MGSSYFREKSGKAQDTISHISPRLTRAQGCGRKRKFREPRFVSDNQAVSIVVGMDAVRIEIRVFDVIKGRNQRDVHIGKDNLLTVSAAVHNNPADSGVDFW